ncbi:hypothetical protein PIB30_112113, partial [Stylosanthes scabra]|nr:hypothetical protein [Stylosanthes scabra]
RERETESERDPSHPHGATPPTTPQPHPSPLQPQPPLSTHRKARHSYHRRRTTTAGSRSVLTVTASDPSTSSSPYQRPSRHIRS